MDTVHEGSAVGNAAVPELPEAAGAEDVLMREPWYAIYEIRFTRPQMWWLVGHLAELREGVWPERPGHYQRPLRMACKEAREQGYTGYCATCHIKPCLNPGKKTPNKIRLERRINRTLEIAAEVELRLGMVIMFIAGWERPRRRRVRNRLDGILTGFERN